MFILFTVNNWFYNLLQTQKKKTNQRLADIRREEKLSWLHRFHQPKVLLIHTVSRGGATVVPESFESLGTNTTGTCSGQEEGVKRQWNCEGVLATEKTMVVEADLFGTQHVLHVHV